MPTAPLKPQAQPGNAAATPTTTPAQAYPTPELVQKVCPDSDGNNIRKYLPFILKAMAEGGMVSKNDLIGVLCTIYVETTPFAPIEEYGKGGGRHGIYYGRGFVQLTWKENYEKCGKAIGVDLVNSPALALKPDISAKALVWYFKTNGIPAYAARGDFDNVRSIVNSGSPGNIGICWGVDVYRGAVKRALQLFTQGIDPNAVGALPVDGSYGLGCADAGVGGSRTITQINPQNQGDALAHVLGLTNQLLGKAIEFRASLDAATDAAVLDLDAQKTFEAKGFGKGLDGTFTTDEVIFTLSDCLRVDVVAYQADPSAPQPQVFVHDTNQNNAPATPPSTVSKSGWSWPMPVSKVNVAGDKCEFGDARGRPHEGIDLGGFGPDEVFAAANGTVDFTCEIGGAGGYGRMVDIKHPDGWVTRYAHLAKILVKKGQNVTSGQQVGVRGGSGGGSDSDYPIHLHFETRNPSGKAVNPRSVMPTPGPPKV